MTSRHRIYLETAKRRSFAGAVEWPGWCRSGRDADAAVQALFDHAPRYAAVVGSAGGGFEVPEDVSALRVVETLPGDATTEFGAPSAAPGSDQRKLSRKELDRQLALLQASWGAFDAAAAAAAGKELRKGPRGGGRDLDRIVEHVFDADAAYLRSTGGRHRRGEADMREEMAAMRQAFVEMLRARARGEEPERGWRTAPLWAPRYAIRRSAWHALDHAWEIEDRVT